MASWWVQALVIGPVVLVLAGLPIVAWRYRSRRGPSMPPHPADAETFEFPRQHRGKRRRAGGRR